MPPALPTTHESSSEDEENQNLDESTIDDAKISSISTSNPSLTTNEEIPQKDADDDDSSPSHDDDDDDDVKSSKQQSLLNPKSIAALSSLFLMYELHSQTKLTAPPLLFYQTTPQNDEIIARMGLVLTKSIRPSLVIGTWGIANSVMAYLHPGPLSKNNDRHDDERTERFSSFRRRAPTNDNKTQNFREVMRMPHDGAHIGIDWEIPSGISKESVLVGPISPLPIVLILHGINNDASFGYVRALMRKCTERGWIAAGFNFRGCGGVKLTTPRGYNGAYTGDLRGVVQIISSRCRRRSSEAPSIYIVGNSLGANLIVKYLGEEGLEGTLPKSVAAGISLGNPMKLNTKNIKFPWGHVLALGWRRYFETNRHEFTQMNDLHFQSAIKKLRFSLPHIAHVDEMASPFVIKNESTYPFLPKIGYRNADQYYDDGSSFQHVTHVGVPLLKITALDDFLISKVAMEKMEFALRNPNVVWIKSKTGGHLGWRHEEGGSWADGAVCDFIEAVAKMWDMERLSSSSSNANKDAQRDDVKQSFSADEPIGTNKDKNTVMTDDDKTNNFIRSKL